MSRIRTKRAYEKPLPGDGLRILVDRLWPRGLSREAACIDIWMKEIAPSTTLRKWFGHDPLRWEAFKSRYFEELDASNDALQNLFKSMAQEKTVTLVYGSADSLHNNAAALKQYLESRF